MGAWKNNGVKKNTFSHKDGNIEAAAQGDVDNTTITKPSVLKRVQAVSDISGPKETFHLVSEENSGYLQAAAASDLLRNHDQAKNCRSRLSNSKRNLKNVDSLAILLQECKRQQMSLGEDPFIRDVNAAPELRCVLGFDWQLKEIEQFCTDPRNFTIFAADPTFNLGNFNLTVTTYRHLKVVTRRDDHHPLMIGPFLISQSKTSETYNYFFGKLTALNKNLKNLLGIGTDGEEALIDAMKNKAVQKTFMHDVFGNRQGEIFEKGLVDSDSKDELYRKLDSLKVVWDERERQFISPNQSPSFSTFVYEKANMIVERMLTEVRMNAGLGNPPTPFYTNMPESANAVIKRAVNFQESEMASFALKLAQLIKRQREDVRGVLLNNGPYKLIDDYTHLQLTKEKWFSMSSTQRTAHENKFDKTWQTQDDIQEQQEEQQFITSLSFTAEEANLTTVPLQQVKHVFNKAQSLLSKENTIVSAPGSNEMAFMVASQMSKRLHYVLTRQSGKTTCENCLGWTSSRFYGHAVAVAEKLGKLDKYLDWLRRRDNPLNLTTLVTFDSNKALGEK
ncbi:Hypothetical predicted protein [Paramuricea clavata]|uniref:Uncharacterized protein n=1 Tax=Paramuricea clavata TaxID=317549 RepID=A0A6S7HQW9_PARCT|nr:Hypothetical predicted protein [Paramuricea clavata]